MRVVVYLVVQAYQGDAATAVGAVSGFGLDELHRKIGKRAWGTMACRLAEFGPLRLAARAGR